MEYSHIVLNRGLTLFWIWDKAISYVAFDLFNCPRSVALYFKTVVYIHLLVPETARTRDRQRETDGVCWQPADNCEFWLLCRGRLPIWKFYCGWTRRAELANSLRHSPTIWLLFFKRMKEGNEGMSNLFRNLSSVMWPMVATCTVLAKVSEEFGPQRSVKHFYEIRLNIGLALLIIINGPLLQHAPTKNIVPVTLRKITRWWPWTLGCVFWFKQFHPTSSEMPRKQYIKAGFF